MSDSADHPGTAGSVDGIYAGADTTIDLGSVSSKETHAFEVIPYDPTKDRESTRGRIAYCLIATLGVVIVFALLVLWWHPDRTKEVKDLIEILYAPLVGLVGAATGYYFGSNTKP